jgi:hypothetical protein
LGADVGGWVGQLGKTGGIGAAVGWGDKVGSGCGQTKSGNGLLAGGLWLFDGGAVVGAGNDGKVGICALAQATKAIMSNLNIF